MRVRATLLLAGHRLGEGVGDRLSSRRVRVDRRMR